MTKPGPTNPSRAAIKARMQAIRDELGPEGRAVLDRIEKTIVDFDLTDEELASLEARLTSLAKRPH
ncbi:hypothetical protein [Alcanivorax quisquiliarum]|uniref:Uncharacterized protein n=1 Tax=Alcanivorax quisquiliarum TaxID=2933565 RepID=A0ABT0E9Z9_9GAMM|nr:hypothetical protein [Alcanivorax quisquiliarum]MCK0538578.1 hypothetical protein [Alcanivorax quisquiliarum]